MINIHFIKSSSYKEVILGLWESIATSMYNCYNIVGGCKIERKVKQISDFSKDAFDLVSVLHICRNKVAHCNLDIEAVYDKIVSVLNQYSNTSILQNDLDLMTEDAKIHIDAKYLREVFSMSRQSNDRKQEEEFVVDMPVSKLDSIKSEPVVNVAFDETNIKRLSSL